MEPHDYRIYYVNIDLLHQYGISVAESQTFFCAKRPQRRRARRNGWFHRLSISVPKDKYDMQEKQRCMISFFQFFKHFWFPLPVPFLLLKSLKIFTVGKNTAIIRWPPHRATTLQVVRTSFLSPRPRLSPPPHPWYKLIKIYYAYFHKKCNNLRTIFATNLMFVRLAKQLTIS